MTDYLAHRVNTQVSQHWLYRAFFSGCPRECGIEYFNSGSRGCLTVPGFNDLIAPEDPDIFFPGDIYPTL